MSEDEARYVPVDALEKFQPFGFRNDSVFVCFAGAMILKPFTPSILAAMGLGLFAGVFYSRLVRNQPDGFLFQLLSVALTRGWAARYMPFIGSALTKVWADKGLPPSPYTVSRYDP